MELTHNLPTNKKKINDKKVHNICQQKWLYPRALFEISLNGFSSRYFTLWKEKKKNVRKI